MIISTTPGFLRQNFSKEKYIIRDTSPLSPNYFDITFFPEYIGGGVSLIKLRGNEDNLAFDKLTEVEVLDVQGTPVRHEVATYIDRFQNYYISIYVYDSTAPGIGSVSVVGVAKRDPQGNPIDPTAVNDLGHNVIWTRPITILPNARNNSELVFDDPPFVSVAQVITQARVAFNDSVDTRYSAVTASNLTIVTSNFKGFDKKRASNFTTKNGKVVVANRDKIVDKKAKQSNVDANNIARTVNNVEMPTRTPDRDIIGGFVVNEFNRYNTAITTTQSFFSSSYIGGIIEFFTSSYQLENASASGSGYDESGSLRWIGIPQGYDFNNTNPYDEYQTILPTTQSLRDQLTRWKANIVKIKNDRIAYIDQPVQVNLRRVNTGTSGRAPEVKHTFQAVSNFTASILYTPDSLLYTTSSEVSQSYLQFTIQDLKPIGGQVDKIRVYYRRGSEIGDWELLNDQLVGPVEFLTDARYPNQTNYGLDISDYYLLGHFVDQSVITNNWDTFLERPTTYDSTASLLDNTTLLNSARLFFTGTYVYPPNGAEYEIVSTIFTTKYYQNFADESVYSLSFNCILSPYTQIQVYQNSNTLSPTVVESNPYPTAFDKTRNHEPMTFMSEQRNRYGKLIGKITNDSGVSKDYTRVVFDFKTDREGLGRPLFRVIPTQAQPSCTAFVSEISLTPRQLNGFTPSTLQFAFPAKLDTNIDLNETIDYKLEYYDFTGNQSEYVTYLEDNVMELQAEIPTTACQSEQFEFKFRPTSYISCSSTNYDLGMIPSSSITVSGSAAARYYPAFVYYTEFAWWDGIPNIPNIADTTDPLAGRSFWNMQRPFKDFATSPNGRMSYSNKWEVDGTDATQGLITSSWRYVDNFTAVYNYTGGSLGSHIFSRAAAKNSVALPSFEPFPESPGVGITRDAASQSYADFDNATTNEERTAALKKRRLYWPVGGPQATTTFTQNGGIYNVKFRLKAFSSLIGVDGDYIPDIGSYMRVYIHNVSSSFSVSSSGASGWYPPDQSIVKIGSGYSVGGVTTPVISFFDAGTGYYYDEYNINLVQYGSPGQLVFEPAGVDDNYFGVIVDNIQVCKIGVTTDPNFIKPALVASSKVINNLPPGTFPLLEGGAK